MNEAIWSKVIEAANWDPRLLDATTWKLLERKRHFTAGFAPALVPLFAVDDEGWYWCLWCHEAAGIDRRTSVVEYMPNTEFPVREIARTMEQLAVLAASIALSDGVLESDVATFLTRFGVDDFTAVDRLTYIRGDYRERVRAHEAFSTLTPVASLVAGEPYDGDFPRFVGESDGAWLRNSCTLELDQRLLESVRALRDAPLWLTTLDPETFANEAVRRGDIEVAWLAVHSPGVTFATVRHVVEALRESRSNDLSMAIANAWLGENHDGLRRRI